MTKRDVVRLALSGKRPPYVPWSMGFTKEAKENVEAAVTKEPKKSMHKAKAKAHKAAAAADRAAAKAAAHNIGKSASAPK